MLFDESYNADFCKKNDITPLSEYIFSRVFSYPNNNYEFGYSLGNIDFSKKVLFTAGIGMNSEPHLLTVMQLLNMVKLQQRGYNTQIVLGDFDVILARNSKDAQNVSKQYRCFLDKIGYDYKLGIVRTQSECDDASRNAILLSSYIDYFDFSYVKEDIIDYYESNKHEYNFATLVSILLMVSDFLTPLLTNTFEHTVVCCGIDESKYAILANLIAKKMKIKGTVGGLFTSVVGGFNNHPKMSKSKPDSCILLSDSCDKIIRCITEGKHKSKDSIQCKIAQMFLTVDEINREKIILAYDRNDITQINHIEEKLIEKIIWLKTRWEESNV